MMRLSIPGVCVTTSTGWLSPGGIPSPRIMWLHNPGIFLPNFYCRSYERNAGFNRAEVKQNACHVLP